MTTKIFHLAQARRQKKLWNRKCVLRNIQVNKEFEAENNVKYIYEFATNKEASDFLCNFVKDDDVVLFKASRGMALEEVSSALQEFLKG